MHNFWKKDLKTMYLKCGGGVSAAEYDNFKRYA